MQVSPSPLQSARAAVTTPAMTGIAVIEFGRTFLGTNKHESTELSFTGRHAAGESIEATFLGRSVPLKIKEATWSREQVAKVHAGIQQAVEGAEFHQQAPIDRYFDESHPGTTTIAIDFEGEKGPRVLQAPTNALTPTIQAIVDAVRAAEVAMGRPTPKPA